MALTARTDAPAWRGLIQAVAHRVNRKGMHAGLALIVVLLLSIPLRVEAQSIWLDEPVRQWNQPGQSVPTVIRAVTEPAPDPRCLERTGRPAETAADSQVMSAGWNLFNSYEAGWGITVLMGLSGHDGMCRPWSYHAFVFVDGAFAGTLAPEASAARTDGALTAQWRIDGDSRLSASFVRYAPEDPLCCPSRGTTQVAYRVERTPDGPVVLVEKVAAFPPG